MSKKIYIILTLVLMLVIVLIYLLSRPKPPTIPSSITPTSLYPTKIIISPSPTPTLIPIAPFTGVLDVTLPPALLDLTKQRQDLRNKTPLKEELFTITYDYGEDKFVVDLKEPKAENKLKFEAWKTINYPAIPLDRFQIQ